MVKKRGLGKSLDALLAYHYGTNGTASHQSFSLGKIVLMLGGWLAGVTGLLLVLGGDGTRKPLRIDRRRY